METKTETQIIPTKEIAEVSIQKKRGRPKKTENQTDSHFSIDNEKIEKIKTEYNEEKERVKPKVSRRKKAEIEEEQRRIEQAQNFANTFSLSAHIGLEILIKRIDKNDVLTNDEKKAFDESITELVKKYFDTINRFGVEANFILITSFILFPRLIKLKELKEKENIKPKEIKIVDATK